MSSHMNVKIAGRLPEDDPVKVKTCQNSSALGVKTVYCNIVHCWNILEF